MILEVNNTFDERRMYFLKNDDCTDSDASQKRPRNPESVNLASHPDIVHEDQAARRFRAQWAKDFHVSPFNSRKGAYSLSATDPFARHLSDSKVRVGLGEVDNTITLSSSKEHPKLIARVFSIADSIDPSTLNRAQILRFIVSWWWVGFVTFPRIVREAAKLFFRRKLHVWYKPEVLKDSMGRRETEDER